MSEPKLLGATLLHTRYGHWRHPRSGRLFIRPVKDNFHGYPGLVEELLAMRERVLRDEHTICDQQRIQWLAQASFGALDICQRKISILSVSQAELKEDIDDWLSLMLENALTAAFFSVLDVGD